MPWHAICLSANGDIKPCCQFTNKGRPPNTEHPTIMENWNSQRMQDLRPVWNTQKTLRPVYSHDYQNEKIAPEVHARGPWQQQQRSS